MSEERKKVSVWPWIAALLVGLPLLYVASFGPACWLADRGLIPRSVAIQVYYPLAFVLAHYGSEWIGNSMTEYGTWGSNRQAGVALMILHERVKMLPRPNISDESL